jgi:Ca2+-binding RTX toxin-like protein
VRLRAGTLSDSATVTGLVNPIPGAGTVTFTLYGPNDPVCATAILTRSNRPMTLIAGTGSADSGSGFTPTAPGTYRWRAIYSGDANNTAVSSACNAPNESTVVTPPRCSGQPATIVPAPGQTVINGTSGSDVIVGDGSDEKINGRGGDDIICGLGGDDTIRGSAGDDEILGGTGKDLLLGGAGDDDLRGEEGGDRLGGGDGNDRVDGGAGADLLDEQALGSNGRDRLFGGAGADNVHTADRTADRVNCGAGSDIATIDARLDTATACERVRRR